MAKHGKKGIASMILAAIGFVLLLDDSSGRLQKLEMIVPAAARPFLPLMYGGLFLAALLLVRSEHKDALEALDQPDLSEVLATQLRLGNEISKLDAASREKDQLVQQVADVRAAKDELAAQVDALTKLRPRQLTPEQHLKIVLHIHDNSRRLHHDYRGFLDSQRLDALLKEGQIGIYFSRKSYDAETFASQLLLAFRDSYYFNQMQEARPFLKGNMSYGNVVQPLYKGSDNARALAIHQGNVTICVNEEATTPLPDIATLLSEALMLAGITTEMTSNTVTNDMIAIVVGSGALSSPVADFDARLKAYFESRRLR